MTKQKRRFFYAAGCIFLLFLIWTILVRNFDVQAIGPNNSMVGLGTWNESFHKLTGVHMNLYHLTDGLEMLALVIVAGFGILGLTQLIKRKSLLKVDYDILVLGVFYVLVLIAYVFFEKVIINYRPVLIGGELEASYPSSTTLLVLCVMPTAAMQLRNRLHNIKLRRIVSILIPIYTALIVIGRLVSGVHWLSDIIGGILLSGCLVMLYYAIVNLHEKRRITINERKKNSNEDFRRSLK